MASSIDKTRSIFQNVRGKPIVEIQLQWNGWVEHFEDLLNRSAALNPLDIKASSVDLPIVDGKPTVHEINKAVRQIKNSKTKGLESTLAKRLKSCVEVIAKCPTFTPERSEEKNRHQRAEGTNTSSKLREKVAVVSIETTHTLDCYPY